MKLTGYLWRSILMGALLLVVAGNACLAAPAAVAIDASGDILLMQRGAIVLSHTGYYGKELPPPGIIDGTTDEYWASSIKPYPHYFIIELDRTYAIQRLAVSNVNNDEADEPGVSAREVVFMGSVESDRTGYTELATIQGKQFDRAEITLPEPVHVRWLKVVVKSNYGNKTTTEVSELEAYGDPVGEAPEHPGLDGVYLTNYGLIRIVAKGNRVEGCYDHDAGYIWGSTDGRALQISWLEHKGTEKGVATMVLAGNGDFLSGLWWTDGVMMGPWFGQRVRNFADIKCDPASTARNLGVAHEQLLSGE